MNLLQPIPANPQPAELFQPANRSFDRPAKASQRGVGAGAAVRDVGLDANSSEQLACRLAIVSFVRRHTQRSIEGTPRPATHLRELEQQQREQLSEVMQIRRCQGHCQRETVGCRQQMVLAAATPPIRGVRPVFVLPAGLSPSPHRRARRPHAGVRRPAIA